MHIINKIKMDLTKPDPTLTIHAVQGEAYSRRLEIALVSDHQSWIIPNDVTVAVRYAKPDRTKGYYDTLPDGSSAWSSQENVLIVHLAPQMLTVPGSVKVQIQLIQGTRILSTFALTVFVEADPAAGTIRSENYINWLQWIENRAKDQVDLTRQAADTACQASQTAILATDTAVHAANRSAVSADKADAAAVQAQNAADASANALKGSETIAASVSAIVAGNEAYTKEESTRRFSPAIIANTVGKNITLIDSTDLKLQSLKLFGYTRQNGIPSPEDPKGLVSAGSSGHIGVSFLGKNLINLLTPIARQLGNVSEGSITEEKTNSLQISGASNSAWAFVGYTYKLQPGTYTLSAKVETDGESNMVWFGTRKTVTGTTVQQDSFRNGGSVCFTLTDELPYVNIRFHLTTDIVTNGKIWSHRYYDIQIEKNDILTAYEPYKEPQVLTISTPSGLPGIPVTSCGNYTDENGQQWICDEVDLSKGVYVQRIGRIDSYNAEPIGSIYMSSAGNLSAGAVVLYPLDAAEERALSDDELATCATLHTHYPNTTILNDSGAGMMVSYVADTKRYICRQIQELTSASQ